MFVRILPEGSTADVFINLAHVVKVEDNSMPKMTSAASVTLHLSRGEPVSLEGEQGRKVLNAIEQMEYVSA